MQRFILSSCLIALSTTALMSAAHGQSSSRSRGDGWEVGADVIYQSSHDIDFKGGSFASIDDDIGVSLTLGYRFNDRLELQFSIDWQNIDYDVDVKSATPGLGFSARGEMESFTPRASFNFNFIDGEVTPYVMGGIGWTFADTNIPDAPPQNVCWWDPWWGYMCGSFQSTRGIDEFTYQAGAGVRWDLRQGYTVRLGYEMHWVDFGEATSTPNFDQFKLGVVFRY